MHITSWPDGQTDQETLTGTLYTSTTWLEVFTSICLLMAKALEKGKG